MVGPPPEVLPREAFPWWGHHPRRCPVKPPCQTHPVDRCWRKERSFHGAPSPKGEKPKGVSFAAARRPRGGKGKGYGLSGDDARRLHARGGGAAGAAGLRHRAGRGAGPGHAHVGGLDVPALRQQAGAGAGGARLHREAAELPGVCGLCVEARQAGGGLRPGLPRLLVGGGGVGAEAAGPLQLHLPALARARVRAALTAGPGASGGGGLDSAAVEWRRDAGLGARGAGEGRERGGAGPRRCPGRRGAGVGGAGGVGARGGAGGRSGGGSRGARLGAGPLASPGA